MAESAVSFVLASLAQAQQSKNQFPKNVQAEIQVLRDHFLYLDYILKDVLEMQGPHYGILNWESDVIRGAHGVEDLVETCVLESLNFKRHWMTMMIFSVISSVDDALQYPFLPVSNTPITDEYYSNLGIGFRVMQNKIHDIVMSLKAYGLGDGYKIPKYGPSLLRYQHLPLRERLPSRASTTDDVVGFAEQIQSLVGRLVDSYPCSLSSISITGMGGIGKTTLAQRIYNDSQVKDHFSIRGWVSISQKFTPKEVLLELLTELRPSDSWEKANLQRFQVSQLMSDLYEYLKQSRYLVVLDDVWSIQAWDFLASFLPDVNNSSRLILTTRNNQVAMRTGGHTHPMSFKLEPDDCWKLFQLKAFEVIHDADPDLEDIGKDINSKCEGLPLLVVDVGCFLSKKTWTREWQRVQRSMTPLGPRGKVNHLLDILLLSYKDLAPMMRYCFLCLGFFPRDHEIPSRKLFHIWIAHGFVSEDQATDGSQSIESNVEDYLQELIDKNLVQAEKVTVIGKVETVRVHPSVHELCILRAKDDLFLEVQSATSFYDHPSMSTRHKVVLSNTDRQTSTPNLRSLLFFSPQTISLDKAHLFTQSKLLRVLDLEGLVIEDKLIDRSFGKLANLRYLNLRKTRGIRSLHQSMCNLHMLLILDIRGSEIVSGLSVLSKVTSLRHLYLNKQRDKDLKQLRYKSLKELRSLAWISHHELLMNDMQKLTMLRKLKLKIPSSLSEAWQKIASLSHLESLDLEGERNDISIPEDIVSRLNIKQLTMRKINVNSELMSIVAKFPHLILLRLKDSSIEGGCLTIEVNGFNNLQYLELSSLEQLVEIRMPNRNIQLQTSHCNRFTRLFVGVYASSNT